MSSETTPEESTGVAEERTSKAPRSQNRRPWWHPFRNRWTASGTGFVAAFAATVTTFVVAHPPLDESVPVAGAPTPTASDSASTPQTSTLATASPSAAPIELVAYDPAAIVVPAFFDDGIAPDRLPPLVERAHPSHPPAHRIDDWVWDYVDERWGVVSVFDGWGDGPDLTAIYLVSPEGVYFKLFDLPGLNYGAFIVDADADAQVASVKMNGEGGSWIEDIYLPTGETLREYGFYEEGGGIENAPFTVGPFANGSAIESTFVNGGRAYTIVDAAGTEEALGLPGDHFPVEARYAGDPPPDFSNNRYALFVDGWSSSAAEAHGLLFDSESGSLLEATALMPPGYDQCAAPQWLDGLRTIVDCEAGEPGDPSYVEQSYWITFDGTTVADPSAHRANLEAAVRAWRDAGFEVEVEPGSHVIDRIVDPFPSGDVVVFAVDELGFVETRSAGPPIRVSETVFIAVGDHSVTAYDRSTGEVVVLGPQVWPDTGVRSELDAYVALASEDGA